MRAIYWLYSVTKVYFFEKKEVHDDDEEAKRGGIPEVNEEEQGEDSPMAGLTRIVEDEPVDRTLIEEERYLSEHPKERLFKDLLSDAKATQSYKDPPQQLFELTNQVRPMLRPLLQLLLHEYQEFLHLPADYTLEHVFYSLCDLQARKLED